MNKAKINNTEELIELFREINSILNYKDSSDSILVNLTHNIDIVDVISALANIKIRVYIYDDEEERNNRVHDLSKIDELLYSDDLKYLWIGKDLDNEISLFMYTEGWIDATSHNWDDIKDKFLIKIEQVLSDE